MTKIIESIKFDGINLNDIRKQEKYKTQEQT
jgi:hypothetical protein